MHSCLSPCGDDEMTPANLVAMAALKGLDVIALTDHNTCRNCPSALVVAQEYGIMFIPGMEINTIEEVHAVCLFATLSKAMEFDSYVYSRLIKVKNRSDIFGNQFIYDKEDRQIGNEEYLLINATSVKFDELWDIVHEFDGVMFPAHIDKTSNSLISNLGFIPPDSKFTTVELHDLGKLHEMQKSNKYIEKCRIISNSDAHYLADIHEPELSIPVREKTIKAVLDYIDGK